MKTVASIAVVVFLLAGAAIASQATQINARLTTETTAQQIRDAKGPLNITFRIAITNQSDAPVTLTRVEVQTDDTSGFTVSDGKKKVNTAIASGASENIRLRAKGIASANLANSDALQVIVRLTFNGPDGEFVKEFSDFIE